MLFVYVWMGLVLSDPIWLDHQRFSEYKSKFQCTFDGDERKESIKTSIELSGQTSWSGYKVGGDMRMG